MSKKYIFETILGKVPKKLETALQKARDKFLKGKL